MNKKEVEQAIHEELGKADKLRAEGDEHGALSIEWACLGYVWRGKEVGANPALLERVEKRASHASTVLLGKDASEEAAALCNKLL